MEQFNTNTEPYEIEHWSEILGQLVIIKRVKIKQDLQHPCCIELPTKNDIWIAKRNKIVMRRLK